ncbi:MAG: L,D-transpeptidase [Cyanobacteria bacterium J06627_32]
MNFPPGCFTESESAKNKISLQARRARCCRDAVKKTFAALCGTVLTAGMISALIPDTAFASESQGSSAATELTNFSRLRDLIETVPERPIAPVSSPASGDVETVVEERPSVSLLLRLSDRRVYVLREGTVQKSYPVAVGRAGWETPTGEFEVFHQLADPGWTNPITDEVMPPGPNNPLGDRWIAFWTDGSNSIGFHGTPNRDSVGKAASHGCIRMYNEDVRELYEMVDVGTRVVVEP